MLYQHDPVSATVHLSAGPDVRERGRHAGRRGLPRGVPGFGARTGRRAAVQVGTARPVPRAGVEHALWRDDALDLSLRIDPSAAAIEVWLEGPDGRILPLAARNEHGRWRVRVPLAALASESPAHGFWALRARVGGRTIAVHDDPAGWLIPAHPLPGHPDLLVQPHAHRERGFALLVRRPQVLVESVEVLADRLVISGRMRVRLLAAAPRLTLSPALGQELALRVDLERGPGRWRHFAAEIPVPARGLGQSQPAGLQNTIAVRLLVGEETRALVLDPAFRPATFLRGGWSLSAAPNALGELELVEGGAVPQVLDVSWVGPRRLRISGAWHGDASLPDEVMLVRRDAERGELRLPLVHDGRRFQFKVDVRDLLARYGESTATSWHLLFGFAAGPLTPTATRGAVAKRGEPRTIDGHRISLSRGHGDVLRLQVERIGS